MMVSLRFSPAMLYMSFFPYKSILVLLEKQSKNNQWSQEPIQGTIQGNHHFKEMQPACTSQAETIMPFLSVQTSILTSP
jgi:hypothetical protein